MKWMIVCVLCLGCNELLAQNFEGSLIWRIAVEFKNPVMQKMADDAKEYDEKNEKKRETSQMQAVPDSLPAPEGVEQSKAKENGLVSQIPTGLIQVFKNGNVSAKQIGGKRQEFLFIKANDIMYSVDRAKKAFKALEVQKEDPSKNPAQQTAFLKTSEEAKILAYNCVKYSRTFTERGKVITQDVWVTNEISDLDLSPMSRQRVGRFSFPADKLQGVPLKMVATSPDATLTMEVTSVERKSVEDAEVTIPPNFKDITK